jgi:hypothetical protein
MTASVEARFRPTRPKIVGTGNSAWEFVVMTADGSRKRGVDARRRLVLLRLVAHASEAAVARVVLDERMLAARPPRDREGRGGAGRRATACTPMCPIVSRKTRRVLGSGLSQVALVDVGAAVYESSG